MEFELDRSCVEGACWNGKVFTEYASSVTNAMGALARRNPDVNVARPGRIACNGCEFLTGDTMVCTAEVESPTVLLAGMSVETVPEGRRGLDGEETPQIAGYTWKRPKA